MEFIGQIIFTAFIYMTFPICFSLFRHKPIRIRNYRLICCGVSAVICLSIQFLSAYYISDYKMSFASAILWTCIGLAIGRYILDNKEASAQGSGERPDLPTDIAEPSDYSMPEHAELGANSGAPQDAPSTANPEPRYLLERDDGTMVWVPASKLDDFDPSDTESTDRHRQFAEQMTEDLIQKYGNAPSPDKPESNAPRSRSRSAGGSHASKKQGVPLWVVIILVLIIGVLVGVLATTLNHPSTTVSKPAVVSAPSTTIAPSPTSAPTATLKPNKAKSGSQYTFPKNECLAPFTVEAPRDYDCFVRLHNGVQPKNDVAVYIRAGDTVSIDVPLGTYMLYYATGLDWKGAAAPDNMVFGPDTQWYKSDEAFRFYEDDEYYHGHTVTLYSVYNGNFDTDPISNSNLPF